MKTIKQFLIAVYFLFNVAFAESPAASHVETERVGRPSLQAGPDGFPVNFPLTYAAIVSYYNDTVTRGYSSVYGPAVLEPLSGKSSATVTGTDGGDAILQRLFAQPLSFRIADPKNNHIIVQANLQDANYRTILYGARGYRPVWSEKGGPGWGISLDEEGVQLYLSEKLPSLKIPGVDGIHIIPKTANGGWSGDDYWVNRSCDDRGCGFNFDLNRLPQHGQVILVRYGEDGVRQKSYNIGTGVPSEVSEHTVIFNGGVYGMKSFSDKGMAPGAHLRADARVHRWEKSPLLQIIVEEPGDILQRPVDISAEMVDENGNVVATATSVQLRKAGADQFAWSQPEAVDNDGVISGGLGKGRYYFIFGWPDGTFPEAPRSDPGGERGAAKPDTY